ncbi:MAG: hypothetical protein D6692_12585 [Planctomycetota bacterium]|nr:MAG: hypothetical protein D6692_12585 [Planctomycetota bacterium]
MRARTTLAASVTAIALASLAAVLWSRRTPPDPFALSDEEQAAFEVSESDYAALPVRAVDADTSVDDLRAILAAAPIQPLPPPNSLVPTILSPDQAESHRLRITRLMAEFLHFAVLNSDADAYIAWRLGRKDRFLNRAELEQRHFLTETWTHATGAPPPDSLTGEDIFRYFHAKANTDPEAKPLRIAGIVDSPDAVLVQLWFQNAHLPWSPPEPPRGETFWTGARGGGLQGYMTAGPSREDLLNQTAPTLRARVGVVVIEPDNTRWPLVLHAFWSDDLGKWCIDMVSVGNLGDAYKVFFVY